MGCGRSVSELLSIYKAGLTIVVRDCCSFDNIKHRTSYIDKSLGKLPSDMDMLAEKMYIVAALHILDSGLATKILLHFHYTLATARQTNVPGAQANSQLEIVDFSGSLLPIVATDTLGTGFRNVGGSVCLEVPFVVQLLRVCSPPLHVLLHLPQKLGVLFLHLCLQIAAVHSLGILRQVCEELANGLVGEGSTVIIPICDI